MTKIGSIYLAGTMSYDGSDSEWVPSINDGGSPYDSHWREVLGDSIPLDVNNPKKAGFSHGGDPVGGIVSEDIELLDKSDSILAYFDKEEQVGTLTELLYAVHNGKPAFVLFDTSLVSSDHENYFEDANKIFEWTNNPINMRYQNPIYWFLVNYLVGDSTMVSGNYNDEWSGVSSEVWIAIVDGEGGIKAAFDGLMD